MKMILFALLALIASAAPALAQQPSIASPDGLLVFTLGTDSDGRPHYEVRWGDKPLVAPSRLGFILADAPKLERGTTIGEPVRRSVDQSWEQPWGERRIVRDRFNEMTVPLTFSKAGVRRVELIVRVYDDGVGFRYRFPKQPNLKRVAIQRELTQFQLVGPATAWWLPAFEWNREEYLYHKTPLAEVGTAQTPFTIRRDDGIHLSIHEAALVDYAGMNLARMGDGGFEAVLTPAADAPAVVRQAPFVTPWRTIQVAADAPGLANSNLILNLNEPNALGDVSWVRSCKYVGIWWGMHLGTQTWASGPAHGATTRNARKIIDFAADNGFCGVLIEGWNIGWDGDWFGDGSAFSFTQAYPDFDLPAVAAYARGRGVRLIGHHETSGNIAHYEDQLAAGLDLYRSLGIDMIKTGYVADAGGLQVRGADGAIRFEWHEGQASARHHLHVVTEAAKRRIAINAHEPIKDTGLRRTYPNWVSREGARGMEFSAWGNPPNPPEHEANLLFTRLLAGPMDFTPGIVSLQGKGQPILSTLAKQLALYVVIYSPLQMAADLPENYAKYPEAFAFIKQVPADWEESRVLTGDIGDHAVVVRQERGGDDWYLGAVSDEQARSMTVKLDFLDAGRTYRARIYRDGEGADYRTNAHAMAIETRTVRAGDSLRLDLAPGGGQAIRFEARGR